MEVIEVSILDPKVKKILDNLVDLELIQISKSYRLSSGQKKSISISRKQIKQGKVKSHKQVIEGLEKWLKEK